MAGEGGSDYITGGSGADTLTDDLEGDLFFGNDTLFGGSATM
jgi:Ca2+-binding RTX toxin-like protein